MCRAFRFPRCLSLLSVIAWVVCSFGCASPSATSPERIARRKTERPEAYAALAPEEKALVDQGQIRVGMDEDAVYLAWGPSAQVLRSGDASGERTTWLYEATTTDEYLSWNYREVVRKDGTSYLDRFLDRNINIRSYVSAELTFVSGRLSSWRMLPKPPGETYLAPQPFIR